RTHEAIRREQGGLVALGLRVVALARRPGPGPAAGAAVARAVHEDATRHAGGDGGRRVSDHAAAAAPAVAHLAEPAPARHAEVAGDGVLGGDLDAPLAHAVDVGRLEARVGEGEGGGLERRHLLRPPDVLGEGQLPDPDDRRLIPERHGACVAGPRPSRQDAFRLDARREGTLQHPARLRLDHRGGNQVMRIRTLVALVALTSGAAGSAGASSCPVLSPSQLACQKGVAKAGAKYSKTALKTIE